MDLHVTLSIFVAVLCIGYANSLQCYWCSYNEVQTDSGIANTFLSVFNILNNDHCKLEKDEDMNEVTIRNCPEPEDGKVVRCTVINGTVTTSFSGLFNVHFHTLTRDCVEVNSGTEQADGGCYSDLPSSSTATNVLDKAFESLNLGDVSFRGKSCYYNDLTSSGTKNIMGYGLLSFALCAWIGQVLLM